MGFKDYIIAVLFSLVVGLGIWLSFEIQPREYSETTEVDSSTSVSRDTIDTPDTTRTIEIPVIPNPDTVYEDTTIVTETDTFVTDDSDLSLIRNYQTTVTDSLISGTITTTVQGRLIDQSLSYTPNFPLEIRVNQTTRITRRVTKTLEPKPYPSIGLRGATDLKTLRGFEVTGSWNMTNGNRFTYGYNPVLKTHSIGFSYNLRNFF